MDRKKIGKILYQEYLKRIGGKKAHAKRMREWYIKNKKKNENNNKTTK